MAIYGYHRTSTMEQHLDRGVNEIREYCDAHGLALGEVFTDQRTGKDFDRPDYKVLKRIAKKGDTIILSELDRLGRNKGDTLKELQHFKEVGVRVMILEIPTTLLDYGDVEDSLATMLMQTVNNMLVEMYATFAHAEMLKKEKRQKEGILSMKKRGDWEGYGRPNVIDWDLFCQKYEKVVSGELKPFECIEVLNMKKSTYYKYSKRYKREKHIF